MSVLRKATSRLGDSGGIPTRRYSAAAIPNLRSSRLQLRRLQATVFTAHRRLRLQRQFEAGVGDLGR